MILGEWAYVGHTSNIHECQAIIDKDMRGPEPMRYHRVHSGKVIIPTDVTSKSYIIVKSSLYFQNSKVK